jgi:hypothetical protein
MTSKNDPEQARRRDLLKRWKTDQRDPARQALPLADELLEEMFAVLDAQLQSEPCDHTLRLTRSWAESRNADFPLLEKWLRDTGGYCDCEVLLNSEQAWEEAR